MGCCIAAIFAAIFLVNPLMDHGSDWWGLLILAAAVVAFAIYGAFWCRLFRWLGLCCPHCDSTFVHLDFKDPAKDAEVQRQEDRRCGSCGEVIIDLDA